MASYESPLPRRSDPGWRPEIRPRDPPAYRILIVEDDPADAVVIAAMLTRSPAAKFSIEVAGSAAKAIERLDEQTFDALILDLGLPDSQGLQTFERIRSASSGAPAIILTGTDDNAIALEALRAGAHEYLKKGHVVAELLNRVVVQAIQVHKSNEAAKASELRYRRLFESAKDGILILEPIDGSIVDVNPYLLTLLGYEFEEVVGAKLWELGPFRDIAASKEAFEELIKDDYIRYDDLPLQARDGHIVPVEFVSNSYPVAGRKVIQCNIRDISARRASSEALRASEARYRHLVETSHDLIWELDAAGIITFINEASTAISGWKPAEMIGRNFSDFIAPQDREDARSTFGRRMQGLASQKDETQILRKDGEIITLHTNARSLLDESGQVVAIAGASHDITRLKAAEREVRESEQKFRRLFETAAVGIWSIDAEARVTFANQRIAEMFGRPLDEIIGAPAAMFYDETQGELIANKLKSRAAGISEVYELKFKRKDGSWIWTSVAATPLFDANGVYEGAMAMVTDITEARHAQDEQRLLSACLEQSAEMVVVTDLDANIEYVNPAFTATTGYSREEAVGQNVRILKSDRHSPDFFAAMWRTLLRGETWSGHLVNRTKEGKDHEVEMTISPVRNSEGAIARYVALKHDVTQQVIMEKRIEQGERVASLGRVAATMAHEFNNVLMSILPFSEIVAREGKDSARLALCAHHITSAVRRGREVTSQVLRFARPAPPSLQPIELAGWLSDLRNELIAVLSSKYAIEIRVPSTPLTILADPNQLSQVFVNLALNARDAMPSGGRLVIGAAAYSENDDYSRTQVEGAVRFAHIFVRDDGSGIAPETLARLFEPLFTTKARGTGIGLSVVQQTLNLHGGAIRVESELGVGTTFHLFLPLAKSGVRTDIPDVPTVKEHSLAGKRILLVEDEPSVAAGIADGLEAEGAVVRLACEAKDLLQTIRDFSPHAMILDVMLPDADGRVVQKQVAHSFPSLPVLLSSGAIDAQNEAAPTGFLTYLQKPYSLEELHVALCNMIGPC